MSSYGAYVESSWEGDSCGSCTASITGYSDQPSSCYEPCYLSTSYARHENFGYDHYTKAAPFPYSGTSIYIPVASAPSYAQGQSYAQAPSFLSSELPSIIARVERSTQAMAETMASMTLILDNLRDSGHLGHSDLVRDKKSQIGVLPSTPKEPSLKELIERIKQTGENFILWDQQSHHSKYPGQNEFPTVKIVKSEEGLEPFGRETVALTPLGEKLEDAPSVVLPELPSLIKEELATSKDELLILKDFSSKCHETAIHHLALQLHFQTLGSAFSIIPRVPKQSFVDPFLPHFGQNGRTLVLLLMAPSSGITIRHYTIAPSLPRHGQALIVLGCFPAAPTHLPRGRPPPWPIYTTSCTLRVPCVATSCEFALTRSAEQGIDSRSNHLKGGWDDMSMKSPALCSALHPSSLGRSPSLKPIFMAAKTKPLCQGCKGIYPC